MNIIHKEKKLSNPILFSPNTTIQDGLPAIMVFSMKLLSKLGPVKPQVKHLHRRLLKNRQFFCNHKKEISPALRQNKNDCLHNLVIVCII